VGHGPVVMGGVRAEHSLEVAAAEYQDPVQALGPGGAETRRRSNRYTRAKSTGGTSHETEARSYERAGRGDGQGFLCPSPRPHLPRNTIS
jgi:hypothetical protein